jgi:hypothetical protein
MIVHQFTRLIYRSRRLQLLTLVALLGALTPHVGFLGQPHAVQAAPLVPIGGDDPPELDPAAANLVITRFTLNPNPAGDGVVIEVELQNNGTAEI